MIQATPPLVASTQELAPEAMVNEGGAIAQPSPHQHPLSLQRMANDYPLVTLCTAFGLGALISGIIAHEI